MSDQTLDHAINPARVYLYRDESDDARKGRRRGKKGKGKGKGKGRKKNRKGRNHRTKKFALHAHKAGYKAHHKGGEAFLSRTKESMFLSQQWLFKNGRIVLAAHPDRCLTVEAGDAVGLEDISADLEAKQLWEVSYSAKAKITLKSDPSRALSVNSRNPDKPRHHDALTLGQTADAAEWLVEDVKPALPKTHEAFDAAVKEAPKEELFDDVEFVCSDQSVGDLLQNRTEWKRASDFLGPNHKLFDGLSACDIVQGALGDCWLLSAMSVLADASNVTQSIQDLFITKTRQTTGLYGLLLHLDGVPTQVVVDDWFPVYTGTNTPAFTRNRGAELWALLLEKAYAKLHGSYAAIEGGAPGDALADLTGAPYETFKSKYFEPEELFELMLKARANKSIMACSVSNWADHDLETSLGLVEGHAYGLLDARRTSTGASVVKIRNPWGSLEWKGDWSDSWAGWTPALKAELGWSNADDGTYWMSIKDYCTFFSTTTILYLRESHHAYGTEVVLTEKRTVFDMVLSKPDTLRVSVHQKRGAPGVHTRMAVRKPNGGDPVGGTSEVFSAAEASSTSQMSLPAGTYQVVLDLYSADVEKLPAPAALSAYSEHPVSFKKSADQSAEFILPSHVEKFGRCFKCDKVLSATSVSALGNKFHEECWCCSLCNSVLEGSFYVGTTGLPECPPCKEESAIKCGGCGGAISGSYFNALGKAWHPQNCFRCTGPCNEELAGPFYVVSGKPVCQKCI